MSRQKSRIPPPLAQRIQSLRASRGWRQIDLAENIGVAWNTVARWELGRIPDLVNLRRLAAVFGLSLDELLDSSIVQKT